MSPGLGAGASGGKKKQYSMSKRVVWVEFLLEKGNNSTLDAMNLLINTNLWLERRWMFFEKLLPLPASFHTATGKFDQKVPCTCLRRDNFYVILFGVGKITWNWKIDV